ncbi:MAG: hypothetical protein JWM57_2646, partial [Phycisphaerales bacterium]|nr:hypothetical protein [Phycisphaerales bacterium]
TNVGQRLLFLIITLAVWIGHRRVLRAGGYSFAHFWRTSWARMGRAWRFTSPRAYQWPQDRLLGPEGRRAID